MERIKLSRPRTILTFTVALLLMVPIVFFILDLESPLGSAGGVQNQRDPTACEAVGDNWTNCQDAFTSNDVYAYANDTAGASGLNAKEGSFTRQVGTGNQAVTGVGFTPKVVIFWGTIKTTEGFSADLSHFQGFMVSATEQRALANFGTGAQAAARMAQKAIVIISTNTPTVSAEADFVSFDGDGFTIDWTTNDGTQNIIHYMALGGANLAKVKVGHFVANQATGNQAVTGVGFQPKIVLMMGHSRIQSLPQNQGRGNFFGGYAVSSTERATLSWANRDQVGRQATNQRTDRVIVVADQTGQNQEEADFVSMDSNGFTLNWLAANRALLIPYLAMAGYGLNVKVGSFNSATTTGNQAVTGTGFQPDLVRLMTWSEPASTGILTNTKAAYGAVTGPTEQAVAGVLREDATLANADDYTLTTKAIRLADPGITPTTLAEADFVSFDADGFTLDWTVANATARELLYWAIGGRVGLGNNDTAWRNFGFALNATDTVDRVDIGVEWYRNNTAPILNVTVSWDGGSTWATNQTATNKSSDDDTVEFLDFTSATAWTASKLNDSNLRLRVGTNLSGAVLDYIAVRIDFTPILPSLTNPTLNPSSGDSATPFNFTIDYSHELGTRANVVRVNVSDATNNTYNNFTMSPTEDPEIDYFVDEYWMLNGTIQAFANAQSDSDGGASAVLAQEIASQAWENQRDPSACEAVGSSWTNCNGAFSSNNQYAIAGGGPSLGNWGDTTGEGTSSAQSTVRYMGGTSPNIAGMTLKEIHAYYDGTGTLRLSVYQGGALNNPVGASLVWDAGTVATSGLGWYSITGGSASLAANEVTWLGFKSDVNYVYDTAWDSGSDFQSVRGRWESTTEVNTPTVAWSGSIPSGGSFADFWYDIYMVFEDASAGNDTAWRDFGYSLNATDTINTVEVGVEWYRDSVDPILNLTVSWNGGSTWAPIQMATNKSSDDDTVEWFDFTSATSWDDGTLSDANFRVRAYTNESIAYLDYITARVDFTPQDGILLTQFNTTGRSNGDDILRIRYNLTSADDTFDVEVYNFTSAAWVGRGNLDQTSPSWFNYTLVSDEKSGGEVRIRFNDTSVLGVTDLSIDYQLVNSTLWTTGVTYYYNTTLPVGWYEHFFWANDTNGNANRTATFSGPSVVGTCDALTVMTSDPTGQLWFNETVEPDGIPFTTQVNVSASFQTGATPALSVTNDGSGTCDITIRLMSNPGTGRSLKFNTTNSAPWPDDNSREVPLDPSSVTVCASVGPGGTCDIWLWADYENALSGQAVVDVRVESL